MSKSIYILAGLLTFASAGAGTTRTGGTTRAPGRARIEVVYQPQPNGDYRLYLFGSDRTLVCEEKDITMIQQGDAVSPLVLSCDHTTK
jgi:hypothetical protein